MDDGDIRQVMDLAMIELDGQEQQRLTAAIDELVEYLAVMENYTAHDDAPEDGAGHDLAEADEECRAFSDDGAYRQRAPESDGEWFVTPNVL